MDKIRRPYIGIPWPFSQSFDTETERLEAEDEGIHQLVQMAKNGDPSAARDLINRFIIYADGPEPQHPSVISYLKESLTKAIKDPNNAGKALGLITDKKGRRSHPAKTVRDYYVVTVVDSLIEQCVNRRGKGCKTRAYKEAAGLYPSEQDVSVESYLDEENIRKIYRKAKNGKN